MDSTRASAIRLLTSSRSMIPPDGKSAETRADVAQLHSIIRRGQAPKPLSPPTTQEVIHAHSPPDDRHHLHVRRIRRGRRQGAGPGDQDRHDGIVAGDQVVKIGTYEMPVYEARPATGKDTPIVLVISEIWGVHEYIRDCTRRFAKAGYCAVAPELFKREGGVAQIPNVQDILKIVLAQKREQTLG